MHDIHGVIPPIITPFDASGRPNRAAFAKLVDWYADAGCDGLWVCGGTGEGVSLSCDERLMMVETACEEAAGRLKIIFHVGAPTTADAVAAARRCQELGVDAISSVPPFFFGKSDEEVIDYYCRLADETNRPMFLYNLPGATGVSLHPRLVERIIERVPTVVGIKHSAPEFDAVPELLSMKDDLIVLIGRGELMLSALVLGASGVVCASLSMAPERFVAVYRAFCEGDLEGAMSAQRNATAIKQLYQHFPVIAATKWASEQRIGMACGPPRGPLASIDPERQAALVEMARELELFSPDMREPAALDGQRVRPR